MGDKMKETQGYPPARTINECIVEIVSDSGEGAQKAGQTFGIISARMGNGV
jgi:2-oxoglutarate ferredoxin oxidoreductase subunit alpha